MTINSKIKICHISTAHTLQDIRIFHKECQTLSRSGYDVSYIVSHKKNEIINDISIIALPLSQSRFRRIFLHTLIAFRRSLKLNARLYHFHDPELLFVGLLLRLMGKKVIYDAHEHLSKDILDKPWIKPAFLRVVVSFISGTIEKLCSGLLSGVVSATDHIATQFNRNKTVVVRNYPILSMIFEIPKPPKYSETKFTLVFTGAITRIRGVLQMVECMAYLPDNFELILAGNWEDHKLQEECVATKGWNKCKYVGQLTQKDTYTLMKSADVGLLTYLPAANHYEAMPNKAFEYLACGLPMVISDFSYWRTLFAQSALYANPSNPIEIAEQIFKIISDPGTKASLCKYGKDLISENLSWEAEGKVLIDFYKKILKSD